MELGFLAAGDAKFCSGTIMIGYAETEKVGEHKKHECLYSIFRPWMKGELPGAGLGNQKWYK